MGFRLAGETDLSTRSCTGPALGFSQAACLIGLIIGFNFIGVCPTVQAPQCLLLAMLGQFARGAIAELLCRTLFRKQNFMEKAELKM